ncbi:hypothetical protein [Natrinema halophilum]|uniref:Uncharacterized protein n=1 Tax=Natrinema halophilum TaxID=1699371 RepID=A0A7D5K817_9EURY|nr:hypothetical protein [Natrinema halophilum]QLG50423.1 hypothetical protein HYG82_17000 [Natrinema halophilum]
MTEKQNGRLRRTVLKTTAGTIAAGVGSAAAITTAAASGSNIDTGDQVQVWGNGSWAPGWENSTRSGDWRKIHHSWAGDVVAYTNDRDGTDVYKVDWHRLDRDWWIAAHFVREI